MSNKHVITKEIKGKEWTEALDKSFEKNVKDAKVDGFRKGKCPRNIFEKKYGVESLYNDALNIILPSSEPLYEYIEPPSDSECELINLEFDIVVL